MTDALSKARKAIQSHDWSVALDALVLAREEGDLVPDDLMIMGDALWWTGHLDESLKAFEEAYTGLVAQDRPADAALIASLLAYFAFRRGALSVAGGWISQAERLLVDQPDSLGHAWLKLLYIARALFGGGDIATAIAMGDEAYEMATRVGSRSAQSLAMSFKAIGLIQQGSWREGLALMDESTAMAMATGDDLRMTSDVYCNTISACRNLGDYQRAEEWTEEAERWMRSHGVVGYTGACQVHRAELKRLHGSWPEAEEEARRACVELEKYRLNDYLGSAFYEIGEVRRRMGDWTAADDAFNQAFENGHDAQPGVSLLALDRGEVETAMKSISKALEKKEMGPSPNSIRGPSRARLLPSLIEIALASGEGELAKSAVDELDLIAEMYESSVWQAWVVASRGAVLAYEKRHTEAVDELRRAWRMWQGADLPYEAARTRLLLGEVLKASGDDLGARRELQAALSTFEQLGARHDVARAQLVLGVPASEKSDGSMSQVTRTFMFTDIVTSTDLIGLIGDASWQELLRWHDRTLRSAIAKNGGEEVRHTGDGFFVAFADPHSGVDCAVDIQRQLASHRRQHGFAPLVRIGLHTAEATLQDGDYSGGGVHASARVGALAEGEQIVVSAQVVVAAGAIPYPLSESRTVSLKGIAEPLEVHTLDWR